MSQGTQIEIWEWFLLPLYLLVIYGIAYRVKIVNKVNRGRSYYSYFVIGLTAKIFGSIAFCLIYLYYYGGGDTTMYYEASMPLRNLFWEDTTSYIKVMSKDPTVEVMSLFTSDSGNPYSYLFYDLKTNMVLKLTSVFLIIGSGSYLIATVVLSSLAYVGIWKIFEMLNLYYPELKRHFAWCVLFVPSVTFWGSGILKDTYTMGATGLFVYAFHSVFIKKKYKSIFGWLQFFIGAFILISIKPYIFMVLLPALFIWLVFERAYQIKNALILILVLPISIGIFAAASYFLFSGLGDMLSKFSLDNALETAAITQKDLLTNKQYGGNSFDVGNFDGSIGSAFALFPNATFAGLFRPMIFESNNIVMLISGLENTVLLLLLVLALFKRSIRKTWYVIRSNAYIVFALIFSIFFAFVIGLTTANFGAMVRFKIPMFPFFLSALVILYYYDALIMSARNKENVQPDPEINSSDTNGEKGNEEQVESPAV